MNTELLEAEFSEIKERTQKCAAFVLNNEAMSKLPIIQQHALINQDIAMQQYANLIRLRLKMLENSSSEDEKLTVNFANALSLLYRGYRMARQAWIESNQFIFKTAMLQIGAVSIGCSLCISPSNGAVHTWTPMSDDLFADDWYIVD
ncbi:Thoeris anti-defense Tad2 family protein [Wielerella bovis]|uniref:Thoeris anti-defense Tad2 family protein n=1 Tax=Wielerella bovis TaxID=2917790 RepID=UPI002019A21C|nr:MW1434 family type I TA system toxin [Wielerella bovis]ULJ60821.1 DUF2829 domain-containing protein [Wielerella bovis]